MNSFEQLMATRPEITFTFVDMPFGLKGYTHGDRIFLDKKNVPNEQYQILLEELAHHDYTVGNITDTSQIKNMQQEKQARSIAYEQAISLDGLIHC